MEENPKPIKVKSAWANGSFNLFVFGVAVGGIGFLGRTGIIFPRFLCSGDWWSFTSIIGASQLKQDKRLQEETFL